jgi:hypothetical protein
VNFADPWPITYRLLGNQPGLASEMTALLNACGFLPAGDEEPRLTILLLSSVPDASQWPIEPVLDWRGLRVQKHQQRIFFTYRSWALELDVATSTFRCGGPDPGPDDRLSFREFFLLTPLLFLMHRFGYFELHAAGCAYQGSGYLLLGASGSGKTTAMLSLIASGWNYLSDDAMFVSTDPGGRIVARPLRRSFSLKPDHLERHPELVEYAKELVPASSKRRFDPRQVWPAQYAAVTQPDFIIACSVADEEPTAITPLSHAELLARLVGSTPWLMFDQETASAHLGIFRSLAEKCFGFELKAGRELFRNGSQLTSLISPEALRQKWFSMKDEKWA